MDHFLSDHKIVLEVEPPVSADATRRIHFYERLGMSKLPLEYMQPSYTKGGNPYQMILMSNVSDEEEQALKEVVRRIKQSVYGCPPELT